MKLLLILWCAFAWAIGGEPGFGHWRRGILILPIILLHGIINHMPIEYLFGQVVMAYAIYQSLFYGLCMEAVWVSTIKLENVLGVIGLLLNGLIISLQPIVWMIYSKNYTMIPVVVSIMSIGFVFVCWLSNEKKASLNVCYKINNVGIFCPKDSWWLASFIIGGLLGGCFF